MLRQKVLNWLKQFSTFSFLDSRGYSSSLGTEEILIGAGVKAVVKVDVARGKDALRLLDEFTSTHRGSWIFGHLGYEFGSSVPVNAGSLSGSGFGDLCFFVPEIVIRIDKDRLSIVSDEPDRLYAAIMATELPAVPSSSAVHPKPVIQSRLSKDEYEAIVEKLRGHILRGDCYEINFCQEFYASPAFIDPVAAFNKLARLSPNPFMALYRVEHDWLLCASPERYLKKKGGRIISQPIKGTAKRYPDDMVRDQEQRNQLYNSEKDRSENVMIVDLVRNDLSRICKEGSVTVDELFGVYAFPQVFQMISTISGEPVDGMRFSEIINATFPMGSMTGAPKKRVMELINGYEWGPRGLFSGTTGYISPDGGFDFNVVIRSILYNETTGFVSMPAGSAITYASNPASEWEECMLKAAAMKQVFD